jgi:hypothetical protein
VQTVTTHGGRPSVRVLRAAVFAAVMTVLAVLAHAAAGAMVPGVAVTAVVCVGVGAAVYPLTCRERGLPAVLAATAGAQLALHVVFTLEMTPACVPGGPRAGALPAGAGMAMKMEMSPVVGGHRGVCAAGSWFEMGSRSGARMLALHVLAGLVSAWWLRRGERAVTRLLRLLWPLVLRLSFAAIVRRDAIAGAGCSVTARARGGVGGSMLERWVLIRAVPRRGPPVLFTC